MIKEGYSPFNLNKPNPLEGIDFDKVCYFDTETTGLLPSRAQIVEIAAIRGKDQFYKKIELADDTKKLIQQQAENFRRKNPRDKSIEELLQMTNYYDEKTKADTSEEEALKGFKAFAEQSEFLLAHNASFDMKMVNERMKRYGIRTIRGIPVLDSLMFSKRFFVPLLRSLESEGSDEVKEILDTLTLKYNENGERKVVGNSLGALSKALFGQIDNWHQALGDVVTTKQLVEKGLSLYMVKHQEAVKTPSFKKFYMMGNKPQKKRWKKR